MGTNAGVLIHSVMLEQRHREDVIKLFQTALPWPRALPERLCSQRELGPNFSV